MSKLDWVQIVNIRSTGYQLSMRHAPGLVPSVARNSPKALMAINNGGNPSFVISFGFPPVARYNLSRNVFYPCPCCLAVQKRETWRHTEDRAGHILEYRQRETEGSCG
jgi:hypothetical protein